MPHLAFELGGGGYPIEFKKSGKSVIGIEPKYAQELFKDMPADAESISLKTQEIGDGRRKIVVEYGKLKNYGSGPALSTEIVWIPQNIQIGSEIFSLHGQKLLEPQYCRELNIIPASPNHILPGEMASFFRLPTFIQKDFEKKIKEVEGILEINCEDVFGGKHIKYQEFHIFTNYNSEKPNIHITFGDLLRDNSL